MEALENTYSEYECNNFITFGVPHKKLEIKALQLYSQINSFDYVPVLNRGLPAEFDELYKLLIRFQKYKTLIDCITALTKQKGFQFINSENSINLNKQRSMIEEELMGESELLTTVRTKIDDYENEMIQNIYSYCEKNEFQTAIFMCGSAHRESIYHKVGEIKNQHKVQISWELYSC